MAEEQKSGDRVANMQSRLNRAIACEVCGSEHFAEVTFNKYAGGFYTSGGPGGDLQVASIMPQTLRICLCGNPITPNLSGVPRGKTPREEMEGFRESLLLAKDYLAKVHGKGDLNKLVSQVVKIGEFQVLQAEVKELRELVNAITSMTTTEMPAPVDTPVEVPAGAVAETSAEAPATELPVPVLTSEEGNAQGSGEALEPAVAKSKKSGKGKGNNV